MVGWRSIDVAVDSINKTFSLTKAIFRRRRWPNFSLGIFAPAFVYLLLFIDVWLLLRRQVKRLYYYLSIEPL